MGYDGGAANISEGIGSGDAQVMNWGHTDNAIAQLEAQQRQRQAQGYQDYVNSTNALQKEFANVRSADMPDVNNAYQAYKQLKQQLYFDPKLQRDHEAYTKVQMAANQALAETYSKIASSNETKQFDKGIANDFLQHHEQYADEAGNLHAKAMQMTTAQRQAAGLNSAEPYLYKGSDFDLATGLKNAAGTPNKNVLPEQPVGQGGFTFQQPVYSYGASPAQFSANLIGQAAKRNAGQAMAKEIANIPPDQIQKVQADYQKLLQTPDYWQKINADPTQNDITIKPTDSPAVQYAKFQGMQYALTNQPKFEENKTRVDEAGKLNYQTEQRKILDDYQQRNKINFEGIRQGNREALLALKNKYKGLDATQQNDAVDKYYNYLRNDAQGTPMIEEIGGKQEKQYQMKAPPAIQKYYEKTNSLGYKVKPDDLHFLENGDVKPIFYKRTPYTKNATSGEETGGDIIYKNGKKVVDLELSTPIKKETFKIDLGHQFESKKQIGQGVSSDLEDNGDESSFVPNRNILSGLSSYLNNAG